MSTGIKIAIGAALVALLLGWFGAAEIRDGSFVYYQTLEEFSSADAVGESARVHGYVALGSIERDIDNKRVAFRVQNDPPHAGHSSGEALPVVYASLETPDLFKGGAEVVVEGSLRSDGTFYASNLLAKCPSKFEAEAAGVAESSL
ncbi:MAG: cytochrome c maturation protein CcmE [Myxococcales bacterium]|nr:cytochrome c maturation protein CcmE [Myxococcales bacterium]